MNALELLKGKKMLVMTDMKVAVELTIANVDIMPHSNPLEKATKENDWWPASEDWTSYIVKFTNGASKEYSSIEEITIIE